MRISLIIPFYNEVEGIPALAERLSQLDARLGQDCQLEYVLVDDGSADHGSEAVSKSFAGRPGVICVQHDRNRGLGAAMRTGFANATGDVLVTLDSDCTYDPLEVPRLLEELERSGADVVTASPYHPDGRVENVVGWRLLLSRGASCIYRVVCATKLYTYTSLMRAYRRRVVENVNFGYDSFAAVAELLLRASHQGYRIVEVPMVLRPRVSGVSKMKVMRTIWMHLQLMFCSLVWRFRAAPEIVPASTHSGE